MVASFWNTKEAKTSKGAVAKRVFSFFGFLKRSDCLSSTQAPGQKTLPQLRFDIHQSEEHGVQLIYTEKTKQMFKSLCVL